jgi:hypothetical protein
VKKFVLLLGAAAVAIYGTFSLVSALQKPAENTSKAATGGIVIAPTTAFANTTLQARIEGKRGPGSDPGACRWYVNDVEVEGAASATLQPGHFKKHDQVRVEATVEGAALVSGTITIANTPPRITNASADLKGETNAEIVLKIAAVDADNDPITYTYEWFKNGDRVDGENGATIDISKFHKGDKVYANILASDGDGGTTPRKSDPIQLGSNAPKITSTPPQALGDDRQFTYQVRVAGAGSVRYELVEAPEGMTISSKGRIEWTVPYQETAGNTNDYKAVVRVTDATGGYSTQEFTIATSIQTGSTSE